MFDWILIYSGVMTVRDSTRKRRVNRGHLRKEKNPRAGKIYQPFLFYSHFRSRASLCLMILYNRMTGLYFPPGPCLMILDCFRTIVLNTVNSLGYDYRTSTFLLGWSQGTVVDEERPVSRSWAAGDHYSELPFQPAVVKKRFPFTRLLSSPPRPSMGLVMAAQGHSFD